MVFDYSVVKMSKLLKDRGKPFFGIVDFENSRLKVAKCRPSRGCCADKKDKHNHNNKPTESSDSRLVFDCMF